MPLRIRYILSLWMLLSLPAFAGEGTEYEATLKKALRTIKEEKQEKLRSTLANLSDQVQSDMEPAKRMQAAVMLAAHYWETNYRLSRYYLGIAEALRDPTAPDMNRFEAEIEHLKIRFRHAALLDLETKKELEGQLVKNPEEPLRLSLVEMLLDTNDALKKDEDFLVAYRKYYLGYPRTVKKDRFLKKAAAIHSFRKDDVKYFKTLESLTDQYPVTEEAGWAVETLMKHATNGLKPVYNFTYPLLKKIYRNSSHDKAQQDRILALLNTPLRKTAQAPAKKLDVVERVRMLNYLGIHDEALKLAQFEALRGETPAALKSELQAWIGYIHSEKGDHAAALTAFEKVPGETARNTIFKEAQSKSMMNSQKFADAATGYQNLLKRNPDNNRYRWYYFWNLLASGNLDAASTFMSQSQDKAFNEKDYRKDASLYWQARTLLGSGKLEEATEVLKPLLTRPTPSFYSMSAKAALTRAQAVIQKKRMRAENDPVAQVQQPVMVAFHARDLNEPEPERSDKIPYSSYVHELSKEMDIDPYLILSIMRSESNYNSRALSQAGAQGLMQIMPYTAVRLARAFEDQDFKLENLQSSDTNITYGSLYLSMLLHYYRGHEIPAVAAYNAGPIVVNKWLKECQNCPIDAFVEFIPYAETRNYVKKVMSTYTAFRQQETATTPDFMQKELPTTFPETEHIF